MEKYEKPVMEVEEIENEVITGSCTSDINTCGGGFFSYGGCDEGCSSNRPR